MFLIVPIGFLKVFYRIPYANLGIVATCISLFVLQVAVPGEWSEWLVLYPTNAKDQFLELYAEPLELMDAEKQIEVQELLDMMERHGWTRQPWSFVTCAFLHGGVFHLVFNMLFLTLFGCAVNSELGDLKYLAFFLVAAAVSSAGHLLLGSLGLVGASGAICGVTGMVAALFPRNDVRMLYFFWILFVLRAGVVEWSALWVIGFWFVGDLFSQTLSGTGSGVAYLAHITGTILGFSTGLLALKLRWVESDGYDFMSWYFKVDLSPKRRRKKLKKASVTFDSVETPASQSFEPIPLALDDDEPPARKPKRSPKDDVIPLAEPPTSKPRRSAAKAVQAEDDDGVRVAPTADRVPVYRKISDYFSEMGLKREVPPEDAERLVEWYQKYRKLHAGARISTEGLVGVARVLKRAGDVELALDAYERVWKQPESPPPAAMALEGAKLAVEKRHWSSARRLLDKAEAAGVPEAHRALADRLSTAVDAQQA
ncbi:MAG: rhomboid family intramembrane serine protease [Planctomycetia bacterium]